MSTAHAILGLYCETPLHAGTGQAMGAVDLPIQREAHTGWPCVYGSGVKGALRAHALGQVSEDELWTAFGPEVERASDHAGSVTVSDARLLLLPVRSLTGVYRWVTAPEVLLRLQRDAARTGLPLIPEGVVPPGREDGPHPDGDRGWIHGREGGPVQDVFLEEYHLTAAPVDLSAWIRALALLMGREDAAPQLEQRLVVVDNDLFSFLAQHATPVAAHVRLKPETKTVDGGALWYEETLAPDTLLYTLVSAGPDRRHGVGRGKDEPSSSGNVLTSEALRAVALAGLDRDPYLQLGGNETVGMGWCRVQVFTGGRGQG